MRIEPEISGVSIVLVGSFNPPIFHPEWFARNGLISDIEKEAAEIELIHRELTLVRIEWLSIQVESQRFIAETRDAPFIRLSDFVVKTFKECLNHTPIAMMGINRSVHFSVGDENTRNRIGEKLAPQEPWGEWAAAIEGKSREKHGGMTSLVMTQRDLDDRKKGYIRAKIEPSTEIKNDSGILMDINDHYEAEDSLQSQGSEEMIGILEQQFEVSIKRSEWIIDQIMSLKGQI